MHWGACLSPPHRLTLRPQVTRQYPQTQMGGVAWGLLSWPNQGAYKTDQQVWQMWRGGCGMLGQTDRGDGLPGSGVTSD